MRRLADQPKSRLRLAAQAPPPGAPTSSIAHDCRHYLGAKPCLHNRLCLGCRHYEPYRNRLCIIKLGDLADAIQTLSILPELRRRYEDAHLTWVTLPNACRTLTGHPLIDRLLPFEPSNSFLLAQEAFDAVINLDKHPHACALANALFARKKLGFMLSPHGTPIPANSQAKDFFHLALSDELKSNQNKKTYAKSIHQALGLTYRGERYSLSVNEDIRDRTRLNLLSRGWEPNTPTVGVSIALRNQHAHQVWSPENASQFIINLKKTDPQLQVLLLAGAGDRLAMERVTTALRNARSLQRVIDAGTEHDELAFTALVDACDAIFSGDTTAIHLAIALGKGLVAFVDPSGDQKIDLFGLGEILVAPGPSTTGFQHSSNQNITDVDPIDPASAADAVLRVITKRRAHYAVLPTTPMRMAG